MRSHAHYQWQPHSDKGLLQPRSHGSRNPVSRERWKSFTSIFSKHDIPAVTQLFTPHWIVRYLVENSLGRLWLLNRPTSKLREKMPYYIDGEAEADFLKITKPEEIRLLDPACGSGHMLTYAFDRRWHRLLALRPIQLTADMGRSRIDWILNFSIARSHSFGSNLTTPSILTYGRILRRM